ncbi:isthmin-2-like isoform X2 [Brienomyrus brachyistius]|uniref:isthmin-2-like isoform X2 n=1 Tax=Brienomyrus brachyistius TaxID=42636 RepID=UPI0020B32748|nr:isthmin-2-like isoform X2 [Brienomyrus brachyistius]
MLVRLAVSVAIFLGLVEGFPTKKTQKSPVVRAGAIAEAQAQTPSIDVLQDLEAMQEHNQVRTIPFNHKKRWSPHLPKPEPEEESKPFVLDLKNFPDLANVDLSSQNPNIQVTIEVIDNPQADMEMDLDEESHKDWGASSVDLPGNKKLFWPLFWGYPDSEEEDSSRPSLGETTTEEDSSEELVLSGVGDDWDGRWRNGWDTKETYDEEEDEWTAWSPCSVSCSQGNQKRTRACGYACTATESRTCDLERCPGDVNAVTELIPYETENSTDFVGAEVDSCEKWLNCKSDFLQKYLQQVLTELPSCPCSYPSEALYSAVSIFDERLRRAHRWRDASGPRERLEVYRPTARSCLRSMLSGDSGTLAAQLCCYDAHMRLLTRGKGAGAPDLVSADFSPELHFKVDVLPWVLCKGDWSRFHVARPPNNGLGCTENPREDVFANELEEAREY